MKRKVTLLTIFVLMITCTNIKSQTVSDFENLSLSVDSYWNGSDFTFGFASGNAYFNNTYDSAFGGYWATGFAYSNMRDDTTAGYGNQYSAITAAGVDTSSNYAVGQQGATLRLTNEAIGKIVSGVYVTNSTYAAISMRDGDMFAKKFGGLDGSDPDWFLLSITGTYNGNPINDTVEFYLADFRFPDSTQDYIVNDWQWVDLTSLGNVDSLSFTLNSSDTGMFGINTPLYFCIDNLTTLNLVNINSFKKIETNVYPNPTHDIITIPLSDNYEYTTYEIFTTNGCKVFEEHSVNSMYHTINLSNLQNGIYFLVISNSSGSYIETIIKK